MERMKQKGIEREKLDFEVGRNGEERSQSQRISQGSQRKEKEITYLKDFFLYREITACKEDQGEARNA